MMHGTTNIKLDKTVFQIIINSFGILQSLAICWTCTGRSLVTRHIQNNAFWNKINKCLCVLFDHADNAAILSPGQRHTSFYLRKDTLTLFQFHLFLLVMTVMALIMRTVSKFRFQHSQFRVDKFMTEHLDRDECDFSAINVGVCSYRKIN